MVAPHFVSGCLQQQRTVARSLSHQLTGSAPGEYTKRLVLIWSPLVICTLLDSSKVISTAQYSGPADCDLGELPSAPFAAATGGALTPLMKILEKWDQGGKGGQTAATLPSEVKYSCGACCGSLPSRPLVSGPIVLLCSRIMYFFQISITPISSAQRKVANQGLRVGVGSMPLAVSRAPGERIQN